MENNADNEILEIAPEKQTIDRRALLAEAAKQFESNAHLGPATRKEQPISTPESDLAREMVEKDTLEFDGFPRIEKITEEDFKAHKVSVPFRFQQLSNDYNFYKVRFPIFLRAAPHWAFDRFELHLLLSSAKAPAHLQPFSYQVLPAKQFQQFLKGKVSVVVQFNEDFELSAGTGSFNIATGGPTVSGKGEVGAKVASDIGLAVGPLQFGLKKIKLDHSQLGTQQVWWRLEGSEFFEQESLDLLLIMQVPKATRDIQVKAWMSASRYFAFADAGLRQAVIHLREALRVFFENGSPIDAAKTWDITPLLKKMK
jgi:hypothetical protein